MVIRILSYWMEDFFFLITVRLIRDNWKAVIENYLTSLISEILFDLQDKQLFRNILFSYWRDLV